jgi:hypothetical protein
MRSTLPLGPVSSAPPASGIACLRVYTMWVGVPPTAISNRRLSAPVLRSSAAFTTLAVDPAATTAPSPNSSMVVFVPSAAAIALPSAGVSITPCSPPWALRMSKTGTGRLFGGRGFVDRGTELTEKATTEGALV